ncbi:MAG: YdcF family protein [Magnetococcales bacterium]|nr:YdcF family protein [Magnetococcales bacterium]
MLKPAVKPVIGLIIALNIGAIIILFSPLTETLYRPLIVDEPPGHGELIVIFSAGVYANGFPGFRTMVRLRKGVDLYRQGAGGKILTLGGGWQGKNGDSYAEIMAKELVDYHHIPEKNLLTHSETSHTYDDITSMLKRFGSQFDFNRAIFVSSSYHTYRIKRILLKKAISGPVVSAEPYELNPRSPVERLELFKEVCREYIAVVYSWLAGWLDLT